MKNIIINDGWHEENSNINIESNGNDNEKHQ
jgi:hypothetical protein